MTAAALATDDTTTYAAARRAMIDSQLRPSGVNDGWVLTAMARVPREDFVPQAARAAAYSDRAVPLGGGCSLAAPLVHARMLAEAAPRAEDHALVVSDSGYFAELLRPLVARLTVVAPEAATKAVRGGPFSLIVVDGAAEQLRPSLAKALAADGRIVTGAVERGITRLAVGRKAGDAIALLPLADIGIPVLAAFAAPARWSF